MAFNLSVSLRYKGWAGGRARGEGGQGAPPTPPRSAALAAEAGHQSAMLGDRGKLTR